MSGTPLSRAAARLTRRLSVLGLVGLTSAAGLACYMAPTPSEAWPTTEGSRTEPGEADGTDGTDGRGGAVGKTGVPQSGPEATGLPCDVDAVLKTKCQTCHDASSKLVPLVTYEDLVAPLDGVPTKSVAARSLELMKIKAMPPAKAKTPATAADLAAFESWIGNGLPAGTCAKAVPDAGVSTGTDGGTGTGGGTTPADGRVTGAQADAGPTMVCTSGLTWTAIDPSSRMNPGKACLGCHTKLTGAPILQIGGTVYPSLHEPDMCFGVQASAYVVVKDATGRSVTLSTGATGNFTLSTKVATLTYPISVKVVRNGKERVMVGSPPHGDCNACHSAVGDKGAAGRIVSP
jgi:hypothetical protein